MWNGNASNANDDLNQCKTCAVKGKETSNSRGVKPKTIGHNHILAVDLKQNHKYRDTPPFILYLRETWGFPIHVLVQEPSKVSQREEELKAQEQYGMSCQQTHTDEEPEDEVPSFVVKEIEADHTGEESEDEVLLFVVKEAEADHTDEESEEEVLYFVVKEAEADHMDKESEL